MSTRCRCRSRRRPKPPPWTLSVSEVLKGPQGTLYGEDSTGGAVNYIAAKPTSHFTSGIDASYGRFNTTDVQGYVSGPITDTVNARLSGRAVESSNWQQSYTDSDTLGARNQLEARTAARLAPYR